MPAWDRLAIRLVDDLDKLKRTYQSHKSEKGTRSRPWTRYATLGNDEAECQELGSTDCPRLVRTFLSWLAERSAVAKKTPFGLLVTARARLESQGTLYNIIESGGHCLCDAI